MESGKRPDTEDGRRSEQDHDTHDDVRSDEGTIVIMTLRREEEYVQSAETTTGRWIADKRVTDARVTDARVTDKMGHRQEGSRANEAITVAP